LLSFVSVAPFRLLAGKGVTLLQAVGIEYAVLFLSGWTAIGVLSLRDDRRAPVSFARGMLASAIAVGTLALGGVAATRILADASSAARVSLGIGSWLSIILAYMVILASRREVGVRSAWGIVLTAVAPIGVVFLLVSGALSDLGMLMEYQNISARFWFEVRNTVVYSAAAVLLATVIGFGLGVLAFKRRGSERYVFGTVNVFQTIPGLAMIGLLFSPLAWLGKNVPALGAIGVGGLGWAPVVTSLTLYALLAITRNTYAGLRSVPGAVVESGRGMGMSERQLLWRVRVPLAASVLFSGERTATVQTVGNSTLGAFVAAFTLGTTIFGGLSQHAMDLTMLGSVALVILALVSDGVLRLLQRAVTPHSVGAGGGSAT
jgi:osmoprotectant transport system permease protein